MTFSSRTNWQRQPNRLTQLLNDRRAGGMSIYDLTVSNPTEAGIGYPSEEILAALTQPVALHYNPDPKGLLTAREAVAGYYAANAINVQAADIILTASTSEAYSHIFTLLCEAGDEILCPSPSYPLFEFLAQLNHVRIKPYRLQYDGEWHVDMDSLRRAITASTKAIVVINPHNPTGMFLKGEERGALSEECIRHNLALIVDEVFVDYGYDDNARRVPSTAAQNNVLTFTLNGISKSCGLPQLKLGWMVVSGDEHAKAEAMHRLEIVADTYLSVSTPVQVALTQLLRCGKEVREQIRSRVNSNLSRLKRMVQNNLPVSLLHSEGGWYAILKIPKTKSEEEWALLLLDSTGVYVFPGYFFEFEESGYLVLSLLPDERTFASGVEMLLDTIRRWC